MNGGLVVTDQPTGGGGGNYNPLSVAITGGTIDATTIGSTTPAAAVFTNVQAGSGRSGGILDTGNGYSTLTFNGQAGDGARVGMVGASSDPNLYIDVPSGGVVKVRVANVIVGHFDSTGYHAGA